MPNAYLYQITISTSDGNHYIHFDKTYSLQWKTEKSQYQSY